MQSNMDMIDAKVLVKNLTKKMTQKKIAEEVGVSQMSVMFWKKGTFRPSAEKMEKLLTLYNQ